MQSTQAASTNLQSCSASNHRHSRCMTSRLSTAAQDTVCYRKPHVERFPSRKPSPIHACLPTSRARVCPEELTRHCPDHQCSNSAVCASAVSTLLVGRASASDRVGCNSGVDACTQHVGGINRGTDAPTPLLRGHNELLRGVLVHCARPH